MNSIVVYKLNTHGALILVAIVILYLWSQSAREEAMHVLFAVILAGIVAFILKDIFDVPRPWVWYETNPLAGYSVRTASLPSIHAAISFAAATTVALHQRKLGIVLLVIAALIGFGRIAANVHYPIDVAIGAVIGTSISLIVEKFHG